jgi:hypothetical protein
MFSVLWGHASALYFVAVFSHSFNYVMRFGRLYAISYFYQFICCWPGVRFQHLLYSCFVVLWAGFVFSAVVVFGLVSDFQ